MRGALSQIQRAGLVLSLAGLLLAGDSQWVLLQGFAWARMIVVYSADAPVATAVAQTFSGQRPCPLCLAAQKGQQEQGDRAPSRRVERRLETVLAGPATRLFPALREVPWPETRVVPFPDSPRFAPPKPRPRLA